MADTADEPLAGDQQVQPLARFLVDRGWPCRVTSYDRYGGNGMSVELSPEPSAEQLRELRSEFGQQYEFGTIRAVPQDG